MDLLTKVESQGYSCLSQASVVGSSSVPIQVTETFNHDYWVDTVNNSDVVNNSDAVNNNDAVFNSDEDEENVVLENTNVDDCHPIEDPDAPPIFDSDEENDIEYEDIVKTYEVGDESTDSSNSEEEEDNEEVSNDCGSKDKEDGPEVIDDIDAIPEFNYHKWKQDFSMPNDEEEEPLFLEEEEVSLVDPTKIVVKYAFNDKKAFKKHLRGYCVKQNCQYKTYKSDKKRLRVRCRFREEYGCNWFVNASVKRHEYTFIVRKVNLEHICVGNPKSFNISADPEFVKEARNLLLEDLFGNYEDSYNDVPIFCAMVAHTNPGSVAKYTYRKKDKAFMIMIISFAAPMRGWQKYGRPVIGLDACHLTAKRGGVLMAATSLDGQNNLVPLGIKACQSETKENWTSFLKDLAPMINAHHAGRITFISDRQKGLLEAVPKVFPGTRVRYCFRHLYKNFKKYYKAPTLHISLWNACKAYKVKHFQEHFDSICKENADAGECLRKEDPSTWSRVYFDPISCCEHMNNNFSESFNSMASNMRDKPIIQLGMMYGQLVMGLFFKRREGSAKWDENGLVPAAVKLINKMLDLVGKFDAEGSVVGQIYLVTNVITKKIFTVNIVDKQCTCLQWQLRGFPCQHDVCALKLLRPNWKETTYVDDVKPLEDITEWVWEDQPTMDVNIKPPPYQRKTGRPAKKRKRSYDEPETVVKKRKRGKCGSTAGHNKRTCAGGDVGKNQTGFKPSTEYDAANCTFTSRDQPESSTARGKAKANTSRGTSSFVGDSSAGPSTHGRPPAGPGTNQDNQNFSQNFAGIGSVSQHLAVTKGKQTKSKKTMKTRK
ncbi:uncharacterized protein LOC113350798 [Papaver somniferum]|uniref:uncharacterized protein LOC113350798 n=1 Tax=Papaver somniferum TaxID=3469 RepID=UPI000E6FF16E|nr:uncharacterized protein LOC113350798 [Papaver somniferum]